ncbi:uncharacterized protein LOC128741301 isoform X2 [Sabethes cyaneus]|uniref:uncharacterized protein LOC128741301 isoform X2 n=1 Tax=Sabethes cyaneus TaxID=53552 RepID=UPI00237DDA53|nr:uncharacterized protein LOC128741301 isoform X2 [Sabethes cyaneus]
MGKLALCLFSAILQSHAQPVKVSKPKALTAGRDERVFGAASSSTTEATPAQKDAGKSQYRIRVVPQEQDEFEKLLDFFAAGEIDSPGGSAESPQKTSYGSYSPRQDDLTEPLLPPPVEQKEPNYYAEKPKKTKGKKYIPNQKLVNIKNYENVEKIENDKSKLNSEQGEIDEEYFLDGLDLDKLLASAWLTQADADKEATGAPKKLKLNTGEFFPSNQRRMDENTRRLPSENEGARVDFQLHGHKGPTSYAYGYDTGKGKNRQFHVEERDNDGNVQGHYGYVMKNGKLRIVKYSSSPEKGFRIEN